ncbi:MAG TPA: hypothetical protein VMH01_06840 [Puia sp.]|nr:hypothetical protein [Puia sp.]
MHLQQRIRILVELSKYLASEDDTWLAAKQKASAENTWFTPKFIEIALKNIASEFLEKNKLEAWTNPYHFPDENSHSSNLGIIMAGNIPLAGFHDFLSVFISGHRQTIKPSSKDQALIGAIARQLYSLDAETLRYITFAETLKGCDGYIATGSNNSARYFDYYFGKYPHIIRRNRTSAAILLGNETKESLEKLADDVFFYFGLGCRNVTKLYVPRQYDFVSLLEAFKKFNYLADHHKYKNNYDYQLAILILNKKYYMTNGSIILTEHSSPFSPISVLHYEYYEDPNEITSLLAENDDIQCIVGQGGIPYGEAQKPGLSDYADGIDSLKFLRGLYS